MQIVYIVIFQNHPFLHLETWTNQQQQKWWLWKQPRPSASWFRVKLHYIDIKSNNTEPIFLFHSFTFWLSYCQNQLQMKKTNLSLSVWFVLKMSRFYLQMILQSCYILRPILICKQHLHLLRWNLHKCWFENIFWSYWWFNMRKRKRTNKYIIKIIVVSFLKSSSLSSSSSIVYTQNNITTTDLMLISRHKIRRLIQAFTITTELNAFEHQLQCNVRAYIISKSLVL